jgi:hypothetical protein
MTRLPPNVAHGQLTRKRLLERRREIDPTTMREVEDELRISLGLATFHPPEETRGWVGLKWQQFVLVPPGQ